MPSAPHGVGFAGGWTVPEARPFGGGGRWLRNHSMPRTSTTLLSSRKNAKRLHALGACTDRGGVW